MANLLLKRIKDWATSITAFRTGDVIPVDGPDGTAKMAKDDLLAVTAQNALGSIHSLSDTATEADLVAGNCLAIDGSTGTKKLPAELFGRLIENVNRDSIALTWVDDYFINRTNGYPVSNNTYSYTDYITVKNVSKIFVRTSANGDQSGIAFYNQGKIYISGLNLYGINSVNEVAVPDGACYARFTCFKAYKSTASVFFEDLYGMASRLYDVINNVVETKDFSTADCNRYGITTNSGEKVIPVSFDDKYSLHFEIKFPKKIHENGSEITILHLPNDSNGTNNGGIIARIYPAAQTVAASNNQPKFPAYFKCAPHLTGFGNTNSATHNPSSGVLYKQFVGDDLFSIRYLGNDNDVVYDITDGGLEVKHSGGATIANVSFPLDKSFSTFLSDMTTACASGGSLDGVIEFNYFSTEELTTDDIVRVSDVPLTNTDYPSYVPSYDNSWHSIDVRFDANGDGGNTKLLLSLDGLPLLWDYAIWNYSYTTGNKKMLYIGSQDFEVRNLVFNPNVKKSLEPKILVYYAHGLEEGLNDNSSTSAASVKYGRMEAIFNVHEKYGFVPVSYEQVKNYLVNGAEIPDKCWTIIHDDSYWFQSIEDGTLSLKFRNLYKKKGLKASFGIIGQNWGISQDLRDVGKLDTRTFDFVLHDQPGYNTMTYVEARQKLLAALGVFRGVFGDTDTWVYPNGASSFDLWHLVKELGFSTALLVGGNNALITSKRNILQGVMRNSVTSYGSGFNFASFEYRIKIYGSI